jgi:proteasome lid subunit RPN8/RPN11
LRDRGATEVGGFGITPPDDLLYVEDVRLVRQCCTVVSVSFDDTAVAEFFEEQVDAGRKPEQFGRIWIHTHPANSARPSAVDEETFERVFGSCDWAVMFILSCGGQRYCRLQFRLPSGGAFEIPASVDFCRSFPQAEFQAWSQEHATCVRPVEFGNSKGRCDDFGIEDPRLVDLFGPFGKTSGTTISEEDLFELDQSI